MKISKKKLEEVVREGLFGKKDKEKCEKAREEYSGELRKSSYSDGSLTPRGVELRKVLKKVCEAQGENINKIINLFQEGQLGLFSGEEEVNCDELYKKYIKAMKQAEGAHWTGWDPDVEGDRERRIDKYTKMAMALSKELEEKCPEKKEQADRQIDKSYEKYRD